MKIILEVKNYILRIHKFLIYNKLNSIITLFLIGFAAFSLILLTNWIFFIADWSIVYNNFTLFLVGTFPIDYLWRPLLWLIILIIFTIYTINKSNNISKNTLYSFIFIFLLGIYLHMGGIGLKQVETRLWGGLTLTLILTFSSYILSIPIGIVLAISRQSNLRLIKIFSTIYIEFIRAIPLITVLFFGQLLLPLLLPQSIELNRVLRAIIAFTLFMSAYIAEDIKGGIQSISHHQTEASRSLGLNQYQTYLLIIIPQAISISLPSLTNQLIGLLQNTSLMAILGLLELLGISQSLLANPLYIGKYMEIYAWLAFSYWFTCTTLALVAKQIENKLLVYKIRKKR